MPEARELLRGARRQAGGAGGQPGLQALLAGGGGQGGMPEASGGLVELLGALGQQKPQIQSAGVQAPEFAAGPALAGQVPSSSGGPAPKPDIGALLETARTAGGAVGGSALGAAAGVALRQGTANAQPGVKNGAVDAIKAEMERIDDARVPYQWGGGHAAPQARGSRVTPLDCSGAVSRALGINPRVSGQFESWGRPGRGKRVTIYANAGHVLMEVDGRFGGRRRPTRRAAPAGFRGPRCRRSTSRGSLLDTREGCNPAVVAFPACMSTRQPTHDLDQLYDRVVALEKEVQALEEEVHEPPRADQHAHGTDPGRVHQRGRRPGASGRDQDGDHVRVRGDRPDSGGVDRRLFRDQGGSGATVMPKRLIRREFWERPVIITRAVFITGGVAVTVSLLAVIAGAVWVAVQLDDQAERRTELALQVTREQDERIETNRKTLARLEAPERPPTQAETTRSVPALKLCSRTGSAGTRSERSCSGQPR